MFAKDVELDVLGGIGVVDPSGGGLGVCVRARLVAGGAVHLVTDGEHDRGSSQQRAGGVTRHDARHGIRIALHGIVVRNGGNAYRLPVSEGDVVGHCMRRDALHRRAKQADIGIGRHVKQRINVIPKVCLVGRAVGIDGAGRVRNRFVGELHAGHNHLGRLAAFYQLRMNGVEGRKDSENRVVLAIEAMHAQLAPYQHHIGAGSGRRRQRG